MDTPLEKWWWEVDSNHLPSPRKNRDVDPAGVVCGGNFDRNNIPARKRPRAAKVGGVPTLVETATLPKTRRKRQRGWCIWQEKKRNRVGFMVRLGKRIFGREVERWFTTRAAADRWIDEERRRVAQVGQSAWAPTREELLELEEMVRLRKAAEATGVDVPSMRNLLELGLKSVRQAQEVHSMPISDAISKWELAKANKSGEHVAKCVLVFERFAEWFGSSKRLDAVKAGDAQRWLDSLEVSENSKTRYARRLASLWSWARKPQRGWVADNPWEVVDIEPLAHGKPRILSLEQVRTLLRVAADEDGQPLLPFLILGLFAGPRVAENRRLTWDSLSLVSGEEALILDPDQTKTGSRRAIPLPEVAVAWLRRYSGPRTGLIAPKAFNFRRERLLARCGFRVKARISNNGGDTVMPIGGQPRWDWPRNGLRHTYCSFAVAHLRNLDEVALRAGNSVRVLRRDYVSAVSAKEGDEYFSLYPDSTTTDSSEHLTVLAG